MENNNDATRCSSATSGSLGILDLGNISDFNVSSSLMGAAAFEIKDKLSKLKENSQSNCSLTIGSNLVKDNTFKIPDNSITNALLSKRMFPVASNNNSSSLNNTNSSDVLSKTNKKNLLRKNESNTNNSSTAGINLLDSQYLRPCSDAEWRVSSVTDNAFRNSQIISNLFGNRGAELGDKSVSTAGLPTPSKGSRSIIGRNKSVDVIDEENSFNFRHDQISARSSSLSGSGSSGTISGGSGNPSSNTLQFGQSTGLDKTSTSTLEARSLTSKARNPFDDSNPQNAALNFAFPSSFGNANVGGFDAGMFFSEDEAKNLLQQDEIEFEKEHLFELPENLSVVGEKRNASFGTFKNDLSSVTRPSFCGSSILGAEIPDKVTKEILFRAKSDQLGRLSKSSNSQRPFFGLSVESPVRDNQTIQNQSELEDAGRPGHKDQRSYLEKLVRELRVEETPIKANYRDEINVGDSSSFRCRSASEVEKPPHHQRDEVRKFRSLENLSPTKKPPQFFGNKPEFQQLASSNYGFNATPVYPSHPYGSSAPCFQCCSATNGNYVATPQMYMPYPVASHPNCHQMAVPFTTTHNHAASYPTLQIIKGPEEIVDYVCVGSQAKIVIPLVNSSHQVLSCSFTLVTAFMGNNKANSDALGLVMPRNVEIQPRTAKDATISLLVSEEGVTNIWIEIETSLPLLNTTTGSFTCYVKLVVEKPNIQVEICEERPTQSLVFNLQAIEKKLIKIGNKGKATVPLIVFLQTANSDDYRFIFPDQREIEETQSSRHSFKRLSPTILIFHARGSGDTSTPFHVPVTVVQIGNVSFDEFFELRGTMTIGLQSTGKTEENLKEIPLLARRPPKHSARIIKDEYVSQSNLASVSSSRTRFNSDQFTSTNKSTNTTQIVENEIPEKDTTINFTTDSFLTTLNRPNWYLEPDHITFDKLNKKRSFKVHNASDNPMWFCVSERNDAFNFSPPHGVSHKCSEVSVALKTESNPINSEYQIKVTCDGFDQYVKATVMRFT